MKTKKEKAASSIPSEAKAEEKIPMRHILIETDGSNIRVVKSEAASKLEFIAILEAVLGYVRNN